MHGKTEQRPFRYRDLGTLATISRFRGVGFFGPESRASSAG
jgi:NADH dehydrogenase FAD-containing subunit